MNVPSKVHFLILELFRDKSKNYNIVNIRIFGVDVFCSVGTDDDVT